MANRTVWKAFRCTEDEAAKIAEQAERNGLSESDYMRRKIFQLPPETNQLLVELKNSILKIGTNINQVVRSCNSRRFITNMDYRELAEYLEKIDRKYYETVQLLRVQNENLFYEAEHDDEKENEKNHEASAADAGKAKSKKAGRGG
ncbi:MAG: MobC family plasmid mobilization relaxosome protein [Lachnospiraceae bacterium]|nr:MobC family plasmid mobilization relaxosome protein [Lachnospiraceae bacterium]